MEIFTLLSTDYYEDFGYSLSIKAGPVKYLRCVIASVDTIEECKDDLIGTIEDRTALDQQLRHSIPEIDERTRFFGIFSSAMNHIKAILLKFMGLPSEFIRALAKPINAKVFVGQARVILDDLRFSPDIDSWLHTSCYSLMYRVRTSKGARE